MAKTVYAYTILLLLLAAPLSGCIGSRISPTMRGLLPVMERAIG